MLGHIRRLLTTGAAYQFGDIIAKGLALVTLPLYTRHVSPQGYGAAESLLTAVILASIVLRGGIGEAFIRFYFDDQDDERRGRIARTATATVGWTTTLVSLCLLPFAAGLSKLLLGYSDANLMACAILGLWAFTNLEMAYAQLRVDERARAYIYASGANVAMSVTFTVLLVVVAGAGASGLLLGNFGASAIIVLALWWTLRRRVSFRVRFADLRSMLRFGLPTVPADASVYALQVVDRFYIFRSYSHAAAGQYAIAIKLATVVFVAVRGFQYAWPPLAYSIESDEEAAQPVRARDDLLRARYGRRGLRRGAARALDGPPARGAIVLRRLPSAALARPRLVALRPVPRVPRDLRPRARHRAEHPGRARGPGSQRRAARRPDPRVGRRARDRRGRPRAVRRLLRDARRDVRAYAQALHCRLRMVAPGEGRRGPRRGRRIRRAAPADRRRRRARAADRCGSRSYPPA